MKKNIFLFILLINPAYSKELVDIAKVTEHVSNQNYLVLQNAQRVYQSKERIKFARASLLPKLNLWRILNIPSIFTDPTGIGDVVQDIAPFLIPANWFKLRESKHLYRAQKESYRALWANEVSTARLLFFGIEKDLELFSILKDKLKSYDEILEIANSRHIFGNGNIFALNLIKDRKMSLLEDFRSFDTLIYSQLKELQYLSGVNNEDNIEIVRSEIDKIEIANLLDPKPFIFKSIDSSPEIKQYKHLLNSLKSINGQIYFSILGSSSYSMGTSGGVFDNIPIQDGLGFGMGPSLRISESEGKILKLQLEGSIETIKQQINQLIYEHNSLVKNLPSLNERIKLANITYSNLRSHLILGSEIDVLEMLQILDNVYESKVMQMSYRFRYNEIIEKLRRITFSGPFSISPQINLGDNNENN